MAFIGEMCWANLAETFLGFHRTVLSCNPFGVVLFVGLYTTRQFGQMVFYYAGAMFFLSWLGLRDAQAVQVLESCHQANQFGKVRKFTALGWGASGVLIGLAGDYLGLDVLFVAFAAMQVVVLLIVCQVPQGIEPSHTQKTSPDGLGAEGAQQTLRAALISSTWLLFLSNLIVHGFCTTSIETYLFVYLMRDFENTTSTLLGLTIFMMTIAELPTFQVAERLFDFGFKRIFTFCHVALAVRCCFYVCLPAEHPSMVLLIEPLHGVTFALMWAASVEFARRNAPSGGRARVQALVSGIYFQVAQGLGALAWAPLMDTFGFRHCYLLCGFVILTWSAIFNLLACFSQRAAAEDNADHYSVAPL